MAVYVEANQDQLDKVIAELQSGSTPGVTQAVTRKRLATKAFAHTAAYDAAITRYLSDETFPDSIRLPFEKADTGFLAQALGLEQLGQRRRGGVKF